MNRVQGRLLHRAAEPGRQASRDIVMTQTRQDRTVGQWGLARVGLVLALALHVADEALTGLLPLYNQIVDSMRGSLAWVPFPTFTFSVWISGLILPVFFLFALSPLVFKGHALLRPVAYILSVIMIVNAIGHVAASLYWSIWAPGVYSSPVLFLAAMMLLIATRRAGMPNAAAGDT